MFQIKSVAGIVMVTVLGAGLIGASAAEARELSYAMGFPPGI